MSEIKSDKLSPRTDNSTVVLGDSGDTISIPAGVTIANSGTATGFGGGTENSPYFFAKTTADSTWGSGSYVQVVFNSVISESDTGSFNTTDYDFTVPSGEGGTYLIGMNLFVPSGIAGAYMKVMVNGTDPTTIPVTWYMSTSNSANRRVSPNFLMTLAAGDVLDWHLYGTSGTTNGGNWVWGWRVW